MSSQVKGTQWPLSILGQLIGCNKRRYGVLHRSTITTIYTCICGKLSWFSIYYNHDTRTLSWGKWLVAIKMQQGILTRVSMWACEQVVQHLPAFLLICVYLHKSTLIHTSPQANFEHVEKCCVGSYGWAWICMDKMQIHKGSGGHNTTSSWPPHRCIQIFQLSACEESMSVTLL